MAYTDIDNPSETAFNTVLYTGTGSEQTVSGVNFQPDWTWLKSRSNGQPNVVSDSVRGATKQLYTADTQAETSYSQYVKSFNSDGFVLGTDSGINQSSQTFVSWNWKAGTSFTNDASSTSVGSVDSAGSVNTDAGFSIINVVKNNTTAHTVAHGLGAVPQMIIGKSRTGGSYRWIVYHKDIGNTHALYLNENFVKTDSVTFWNDTTPTSSVFSLGTDNSWNGTSIFYCFAEKKGFSKFGTYVGNNNANGNFIYTGFKPAFFLVKNATEAGYAWELFDNKRNHVDGIGNIIKNRLFPDTNAAEGTNSDGYCDFVSNGVKIRKAGDSNSANTYIYWAIAENPFVTSTGTPTTAR